MKISNVKEYGTLAAVVVLAIIAVGFKSGESKLGGGGPTVRITNATHSYATTTATALPVQLVARNYERSYCAFINDSDTAVYLTFKNFDSATAASTSVGATKGGLRLNASGGTYECDSDGLVVTDVWASSSASNKAIITVTQ